MTEPHRITRPEPARRAGIRIISVYHAAPEHRCVLEVITNAYGTGRVNHDLRCPLITDEEWKRIAREALALQAAINTTPLRSAINSC